jgi:hypothetical protein
MRPHITILKLQFNAHVHRIWLTVTNMTEKIYNIQFCDMIICASTNVNCKNNFETLMHLLFQYTTTCVICSFYESFQCDVYILYIRDTRVAQWVRSYLTAHTGLSLIRSGFAPSFENYKKGALDSQPLVIKVYQLLADGRWFSPAFSTTKTGRHDIAEILLCLMINFKPENT